jgi:predicted transcriptional regulator
MDELIKLLMRHYRFDDDTDAIDLVMLQFDLATRLPSLLLADYLATAFQIPYKAFIDDLKEGNIKFNVLNMLSGE